MAELQVPAVTVNRHVEERARLHPERPALVFYGGVTSYGALHRDVEALAGYLQQGLAIAAGDRVLLLAQNSPQFVTAYYAILRADAVVVPVNPMNRTAELRHFLADSGARLAILGEEVLPAIEPLLDEGLCERLIVFRYADAADPDSDLALPASLQPPEEPPEGTRAARPEILDWQAALEAGLAPRPQAAGPDELAVIPYSSGTTGAPKGCMHTHRTVMTTVLGTMLWNRPADYVASVETVLASLPFFHVTAMQGVMNGPLYEGHRLILMARWDRRTAARLIERYRITRWRNITTMAIDLLSDPELAGYDLSSLQGIGGGGAAMPAAVFDALKERTGLTYIEGYGLTETMAATHINPADRPRRACLGLPVFDVDSRIRDPESGALLGPGEPGEIVIDAPQVFKGYWNDPEATRAAFVEIEGRPFFRTGDIGYVDEEGFFYLVDRLKRMVNLGGLKVWPSEVEQVLHRHPAIAEVCVLAARDPRLGEAVKALVVLKPGAGEPGAEEIIAWARERLAGYKAPRIVAFVESLPRGATGKVDWRRLQEEEYGRAAAAG